MRNKTGIKGLLHRKMADPAGGQEHENRYEAFRLEAQILLALERKGMSFESLAKATNTQKSNVSRDLSAGGIQSARFSRICAIANALDMKLVPLLLPREKVDYLLPRIEEIVVGSVATSGLEARIASQFELIQSPILEEQTSNVHMAIDVSALAFSLNSPPVESGT